MDDKIFGISERALVLCQDRAAVLTSNIVNSSTPKFKAQDMDFYKLVKQTSDESSLRMNSVDHLSGVSNDKVSEPLLYRVPMQKSLDGNTVDGEIERKNFIENAIHYQVNLTFIQNKTDQLMKAIKGE